MAQAIYSLTAIRSLASHLWRSCKSPSLPLLILCLGYLLAGPIKSSCAQSDPNNPLSAGTVSYTHLTLPTICSV